MKNQHRTPINSDSGELIRHLYHEAAKSQKYGGLNDDEALSLITINPAKQLGIDNRVGSIEEGKDGDIAIFKGHPLSIYTIPQMTIIDGIVYFDINTTVDDMRLIPDPERAETEYIEEEYRDGCMSDVNFMELFGSKY